MPRRRVQASTAPIEDTEALAEHVRWLNDQVADLHQQLRDTLLAGTSTAQIRTDLAAAERELAEVQATLDHLKTAAEAERHAQHEATLAARTTELASGLVAHQATLLAALQPPPFPALASQRT